MKPEVRLVIERYCGVYNVSIENGKSKEYFFTRACELYRLINQLRQKYQCNVSFKGFKNEEAHMSYIRCFVDGGTESTEKAFKSSLRDLRILVVRGF